jgi:hypothetical protein
MDCLLGLNALPERGLWFCDSGSIWCYRIVHFSDRLLLIACIVLPGDYICFGEAQHKVLAKNLANIRTLKLY